MAIRLTLILSGKAYEEHEFDSFTTLRVGRGEDCEVRIDNLGISRLHCSITNLGGTYQLRNLNQGTGTRVNGAKVDTYNLNDGDAISLGKFTIAFACDQDWSGTAGTSEIGEATLGNTGAVRKAKESSLNRALGYLELPAETREPEIRELTQAFFLVGKDADADVLLEGWGAPRVAAIVVRDNSGFSVLDVSPKQDSLTINGTNEASARLSDGDALDVRGQAMTFRWGARMTVRLVVTDDGKVLDRYEFESPKSLTIGRHEDCDVQINSHGISRRHCEIVKIDRAYVLRDLKSSNGTFVKGEKIKSYALNNDDMFSVVGVKIKFTESEPEPQVVVAEPLTMQNVGGLPELTMNVNPKALRLLDSGSHGRPTQAKGHIVVRTDDDEGKNVILRKGTFVIGKDEGADLHVAGLLAPRMAALIIRDTSEFWLVDVSPKGNCLTVNGHPTRIRGLENGDIVKVLKKATFQFYEGLPRMDSPDVSHLATRRFKRGDFRP